VSLRWISHDAKPHHKILSLEEGGIVQIDIRQSLQGFAASWLISIAIEGVT
jgi:hypothetical protein